MALRCIARRAVHRNHYPDNFVCRMGDDGFVAVHQRHIRAHTRQLTPRLDPKAHHSTGRPPAVAGPVAAGPVAS